MAHRLVVALTSLYWYNPVPNFGDDISRVLLEHYGFQVVWSEPATAQLVMAGSVMRRLSGTSVTILGTGTQHPSFTGDLSSANVLAVRGRLTRRVCGLPDHTPVGDPGILVADLPFPRRRRRSGKTIVPHYADQRLRRNNPRAWCVNIQGPVERVLSEIASARVVLSSSLHALVAADALGVPHVWTPSPKVVGKWWKFQDYASAFGELIEPGVERLTPRAKMAERQAELRELIESIRPKRVQPIRAPYPNPLFIRR